MNKNEPKDKNMKIYNTNEEIKKDIKNGVLKINDDVQFNCNVDIEYYDIKANNIKANNIDYYAFCVSYIKLTCNKISGRRENSSHMCLDSDIVIKPKVYKITIDNKDIELSEESFNALKKSLGIK